MSEEKKSDIQSVQVEYGQLCAKAGHINYQIWALKQDLDLIHNELRELNFKAAKIQSETKVEEKASE